MLAEPYAVDEEEVGIDDFAWRVPAEHAQEQGDEPLDDEGVALGREMKQSVAVVSDDPHPALASLDEVVIGLIARIERLHVIAQVDEQLVFVHPVGEVGKLGYHLILNFVDGHGYLFFL